MLASLEDWKVIVKDAGIVIRLGSASFLIPAIAALLFGERLGIIASYLLVAVIAFCLGSLLAYFARPVKETEAKHALISIAILWLLYTGIAALPFVLISNFNFLDALFETMSAITTTGLTIVADVSALPASLVFWRSLVSWIGGLGFVVMASIGILGTYTRASRLIIAEGREQRIKPNLKNAAKETWLVYLIVTLIGIIVLFAAGLSPFHAVNHAMSAISTTGLSSLQNGLVGESSAVLYAVTFVMLLGGISFAVHHSFFMKRNFLAYFKDLEVRLLAVISIISILIVFPKLLLFYGSSSVGLVQAVFNVAGAVTNGGFNSETIAVMMQWPSLVFGIFLVLMFIGGSTGSTSGGIKLARFWIFLKSIYWKSKQLMLPENTFFKKSIENRAVSSEELRQVNYFILLYASFILLGAVVLTIDGSEFGKALFETISAQSNAGLSSGISHQGMSVASELMLVLNMWVGRLEIIPVLALAGAIIGRKRRY